MQFSCVVSSPLFVFCDLGKLKFGKVITNCAYNLQHVLLPVLFYIYRSLTNIMCSVFFQRIVASPTPIMSLMLR